MEEDKYYLCYVDGNKAYFTNDWEHQWGDDWDDTPYECNADEPYDDWIEATEPNPLTFDRNIKIHLIKIKAVYFEFPYLCNWRPCDTGSFSVEEINKGLSWIITDDFEIKAKTEYNNFVKIVEENRGIIYTQKERGK